MPPDPYKALDNNGYNQVVTSESELDKEKDPAGGGGMGYGFAPFYVGQLCII